jgi:hypothetical protein
MGSSTMYEGLWRWATSMPLYDGYNMAMSSEQEQLDPRFLFWHVLVLNDRCGLAVLEGIRRSMSFDVVPPIAKYLPLPNGAPTRIRGSDCVMGGTRCPYSETRYQISILKCFRTPYHFSRLTFLLCSLQRSFTP